MAYMAQYHGTARDAVKLIEAIEHNCECQRDSEGKHVGKPCSAHQMMNDQRLIDRLRFERHERAYWLAQEIKP